MDANLQHDETTGIVMHNPDFIKDSSGILNLLMKSKEERTSIGVYCPVLDSIVFVTSVEDIVLKEGQTVVVLKHYDSSGYILPSRKINLNEIIAVCPFTSEFRNPFLDNLARDKSWLFGEKPEEEERGRIRD